MLTIYKYEVNFGLPTMVMLPGFPMVLHVGSQDGRVFFWAKVDTEAPLHPHYFQLVVTGGEVPPRSYYRGTTFVDNGFVETFVVHLFELGKPEEQQNG